MFELIGVPQSGDATPRQVCFAEGLGGRLSEIKGHKDAVRIKLVVTEGAALLKAGTDIERVCGPKRVGRAGFKAQARVATLPRHRQDVIQNGFARTPAAQRQGRSHGLDFAMHR